MSTNLSLEEEIEKTVQEIEKAKAEFHKCWGVGDSGRAITRIERNEKILKYLLAQAKFLASGKQVEEVEEV